MNSHTISQLTRSSLLAIQPADYFFLLHFIFTPCFLVLLGRVTAKPLRGPAARLGLGPDWSLPSLEQHRPLRASQQH